MKKCFKCLVEKPKSEFYRHPAMGDGLLGKCKECAKRDVKEKYNTNRNDPNYIIKERNRGREKHHRLYKGIKAKKEVKSRSMNAYLNKYPEKKLATTMVSNAIRDGRLKKMGCEVCGDLKVQAHHEDYTKPLDVMWLCVKHHNELHVKKREESLHALLR